MHFIPYFACFHLVLGSPILVSSLCLVSSGADLPGFGFIWPRWLHLNRFSDLSAPFWFHLDCSFIFSRSLSSDTAKPGHKIHLVLFALAPAIRAGFWVSSQVRR